MQEKSHRGGRGSAGSDLQTFLCKDKMIIRSISFKHRCHSASVSPDVTHVNTLTNCNKLIMSNSPHVSRCF